MDTNQLLAADRSLKQIQGQTISFSKLGGLDSLEDHALLFIKNKTFLKKLKDKLAEEKIHLIVPQSLYTEFQDELSSLPESLFITPDIGLSISVISKAFYDELFQGTNHYVDGRQMGTAYVHPSTTMSQHVFLGEQVRIGKNCMIHPHVTIMAKSTIGDDTEIFPHVVVAPHVAIGQRVKVHANTSLGQDGFGYNYVNNIHHKIWHVGQLIIEDDVEIGASSCIDRGSFSSTIVGKGTKIDNQVHIAHNCVIGQGVIICGQVGLSGSVKIGDFSFLGGKVGVSDGVSIGAKCQVAGGAMVTHSWPEKSFIAGHPARNLSEWLKGVAYVRRESLKKVN